MSEQQEAAITVSIDEWVEKAKSDPHAYLERQATEIFLTALGTTEPYCEKFFLKGGLLMGIVYNSPRQTTDIDYSTTLEPDSKIAEHLKQLLNSAFPRIAAGLGYPDIICLIQTIKLRPREEGFDNATAPSFEISAGYAKRGSPQEKRVHAGTASNVLRADISFKEPVGAIQIVKLGTTGASITAYSLKDMIAEKYRAFLQQEARNRSRRQDIYDLALLLGKFTFDDAEKKEILNLLLEKSEARGISPTKAMISDPALIERAKKEWDTMKLELAELPAFETCHTLAQSFYESLPWEEK